MPWNSHQDRVNRTTQRKNLPSIIYIQSTKATQYQNHRVTLGKISFKIKHKGGTIHLPNTRSRSFYSLTSSTSSTFPSPSYSPSSSTSYSHLIPSQPALHHLLLPLTLLTNTQHPPSQSEEESEDESEKGSEEGSEEGSGELEERGAGDGTAVPAEPELERGAY